MTAGRRDLAGRAHERAAALLRRWLSETHTPVAPGALRLRVGRLLNDKMPTGVAVSPAMNHGGPFPATAQAGFSAVGIPGALLRFAMLQCYDNVRPERLPAALRDENPRELWRQIDGRWTQDSL